MKNVSSKSFLQFLFFLSLSLFVEAKGRKEREKLPISKGKQGEPGNCLPIDPNFPAVWGLWTDAHSTLGSSVQQLISVNSLPQIEYK
jgi:hypothetical protein